jgi:hypothetical protein
MLKAPCLEWTSFYGSPNSTKISSSKVVLALDGHENDQDYNVNMQHVRSSLVNSRLHNNFLEHSCLV